MLELRLIFSDDCSKCHQLMSFLPKWCEDNEIMFSADNINTCLEKDEIVSLPTIILKQPTEEWYQITKMDMETFISNKSLWEK